MDIILHVIKIIIHNFRQQIMMNFWKLVFNLFYALAFLVDRAKNIFQYVYTHYVLVPFYHQNKLNKLTQHYSTLGKKPSKVVLSVKVGSRKNKIQDIVSILETVKKAQPEQISIFFSGDDHIVQELEQTFNNELEMGRNSDVSKINIINFHNFYQQLPKPIKQGKTPLVITLSDYKNVNNLPYPFLIDAEIGFCPMLGDCSPCHIVNCFQQYASSKQRNGK